MPDAPTLVIYNHYDVQPPEPLDEWTHPPFGAEIADGVMYGRGTTDAKGNLLAHLKAVDAFRPAGVPLPCHLKFLFDGEEESGSPSLPAFVAANTDLLAADAALSFDGGFTATTGRTSASGRSGLLFVEIRVRGASKDLHSARARLVENPAGGSVWALGALKDADERVPWTASTTRSARSRRSNARHWSGGLGRRSAASRTRHDRFLGGVSGTAALERLLFTPTCNIAGFATGWMGEGHKTVLPSRAACRLDFRLVADQDPNTILASLRRFSTRMAARISRSRTWARSSRRARRSTTPFAD